VKLCRLVSPWSRNLSGIGSQVVPFPPATSRLDGDVVLGIAAIWKAGDCIVRRQNEALRPGQ
jgi:hypothetical protein